jgi:GAF domain-containing protein
MIKKFLSPPVFEKEEDNFRAKFINTYAWISIFLVLIAVPYYLLQAKLDFSVIVSAGVVAVMLIAIYMLRRGKIIISGAVVVVAGWLLISSAAMGADGIKGTSVFAYIALALLGSIIVSLNAGVIVIITSIIMLWTLALLEVNGYITPNAASGPIQYALTLTVIFIIIGVLIYFSTSSLTDAIKRANKSEENLRVSNKELQELNQSLEDRVASRTAELERANDRNTRRARQFEAVAEVTRATTANENIGTLLPRLASLISKQFGFYHTGIFLLDETRSNAVLRASNSEGGKRMLDRKHKLEVGQAGIVGFVSATGNPRIALDVGADAVFFDNPDLPNTRSEMALPLRVAGEIIGVLDVQSTESNAFQQEDIEVLSTLADQVSIAIQNARSYETTQHLLQEAQKSSSLYLQDAWGDAQSDETLIGYRASGDELQTFNKPLTSANAQKAIEIKQTVVENGKSATLAVPIRLRDEVIGIMDIRTPTEHDWDVDEVDIAEAVAERLSLALETSLLLKSTQKRAQLEKITSEISNKIGASTQFDAILRTAAEELSRVLGGSDVLVQIQSLETPDVSEN